MTKKNNTTVNEGFRIMADMAWHLINRIESLDEAAGIEQESDDLAITSCVRDAVCWVPSLASETGYGWPGVGAAWSGCAVVVGQIDLRGFNRSKFHWQ